MVYRVRLQWTGAPVNGPSVSTFFFDDTGGTAQAASDHVAAFAADLDNGLADTLSWRTEPEVDTLDTATGVLTAVTSVTPAGGTGVNTAEPLPPATQGLIRWTTGQIVQGRALKGHTFIPGFCENQQTNGAPSAAVISQFEGFAEDFEDLASPQMVIWSRTHGVAAPALGSSMWEKWAILRSRRD